jgi:hypothetical protein
MTHILILAVWEVEMGMIIIAGQPGQEKFMIPHLLNGKELGMVAYFCHPS